MAARFTTFATVLAIALLTAAPGAAQTVTATLTGTVADSSGSAVPGASITLTNELSGDVRRTTTNSAGYYSLPAVPAATYTLTVESSGFQKSDVKGIVLNSADQRNVNVTLQVGSVSETVEVVGGADQLETINSGEKAQVLDAQTLQSIAVVGRSAAEYLKIMPGMAPAITTGATNAPSFTGEVIGINGSGNAGRQSAIGAFTANGTPTASTEITSDGAHTSDPGCNCATPVNPNPEMLQEVHVLQAAFSSENAYGPVVINTTTKAGGTTFHGELYDSIRNYNLNANDAANNAQGIRSNGAPVAPRPQNVFNFPGGNIGGPVLIPHTNFNKNRDKLFFFSGFEYFYQSLNTAQIKAVVPTAAMRAGDFSQTAINALNPAAGVGGGLKPITAFPGGMIPASAFDKGGAALMNLLPQPNADPFVTGGYNYFLQAPYTQNGWQMVHRIDYSISDNTKLFVRYYHQQEVQNFPISLWGGATAPTGVPWPSSVIGNNHSESVSANLTRVFAPSLTNEFVVAYTYIGFPNTLANPTAGERNTVAYPYHGVFNNGDPYIPDFIATGLVNMAQQGGFDIAHAKYNGVYFANKPLASIGDNVVKIWRTHTIRIGSYDEYYGNIQPTQQKSQGVITTAPSDPTGTGNALADLLLGNVSTFTQANFNPNQRVRSILIEGYVQDSWKITKRLTLDYGLRFQHDPQGKDLNGIGHAIFVPSLWSNNPNVYLPGFTWHAINPKVANEGYPTRALFYAPRFGGAWDVFGNGRTVIRGGIGLYRYRGPSGGGGAPVGLTQPTGQVIYSPPTAKGTTLAALDQFTVPFQNGQSVSQIGLPNNLSDQLSLAWTDNFGITQRLPWNSEFEAAFVNTMGRHIAESLFNNLNPVPYGAMLSNPNASNLLYRQYPNYQDITLQAFDAYSDYNALQVTYRHRTSRYLISANYTYSKVTGDTVGNPNASPALGVITAAGVTMGDGLNAKNDHGPLSFDRRQVFNFAYSAHLPGLGTSNRFVKGAINGWTASGIMQIWSGANLENPSQASSEFGLTMPAGTTTQIGITGTPDVAIAPVLTCDPRSNLGPHQYLNPNCFALPTPGHNGSFVIPEAFGPGYFNTDLSLFKDFHFTERKTLQFRVEGFDVLNHSNYTFGLDNNLNLAFNSAGKETNALFGTTTTKTGHRILQFVAKFYF